MPSPDDAGHAFDADGEPTPDAAMHVPLDAREVWVARLVAGYDGYSAPKMRRETEKGVRAAAARRAREGRDVVSGVQRQLAAASRFGVLPAVESLTARIQRFVDRLDSASPKYGRWFDDVKLSDDARAGVVALDHALLAAADDGVAALKSLGAGSKRSVDAVDGLVEAIVALGVFVDGWHAAFDTRMAALSASVPPGRPAAPSVFETAIGGRIAIAGEPHTIAGRWQWDRGDKALVLDDTAGGLRLWADTGAGIVLFEAQAVPVDLPPPEQVSTDSETFARHWSDEGAAGVREAGGVRRAAAERWMYHGDAGGRLWVERTPAGARTWLGLPLDEAEATVI